jgi:hypothetical protein
VARGRVTLIARSVGGSNQCFGGSLIHPPTAGSGYLKESELENQAGSRYLEKKTESWNFGGWVLQNPQRISGFQERTSGSFPVIYRFFSFVIFFAESELGPSRSVHRSRAYMPGLTSSKEPSENHRTAPTLVQIQLKWYLLQGINISSPFTGIRGQGHGPGFTLHWNILATGLTLHWNIPRLSCTSPGWIYVNE